MVNDKPSSQLYSVEKSNLTNILRCNLGKNINIFMTFPSSSVWNSQIFSGLLKGLGNDHIVLEDIKTNKIYFLLIKYLDYIEFEDKLDYFYPYNSTYK